MRVTRRGLHKNKYMLLAATLFAFGVPGGYAIDSAAGQSVHAQITHDALAGTLADANLKMVVDANDSQDSGADAKEKRRHFDGTSINAAINYINREKNTALNMASEADTDAESRGDALRHFGLMVHAVQDFYLRSNYVELALEDGANKADPYNIPLVDWSKIPAGYVGVASGTALQAAKSDDPSDALNKDSAQTSAGRRFIDPKTTTFSVARELAVRETQRQWNLFETLVRSKCGSRSAAVVAALRQAPPSTPDPLK